MVYYFILEGGNSFYSTRNTLIIAIPGIAVILIGADTLGFHGKVLLAEGRNTLYGLVA